MANFETLRYKIEHYQSSGRLIAEAYELCQNPKRFVVPAGQLPLLAAYEPLLDLRPEVGAERQLAAVKKPPPPPPATCPTTAIIWPATAGPNRNPPLAIRGWAPCAV